VPTDFSANSKVGIRFAIQLSKQQKSELIFVYVFHAIKMPQWSDAIYKKYMDSEENILLRKLQQFIVSMYRSMQIRPTSYSCVVKHGISPDISIMDFCRSRNNIDFICIATRGASKLNKLFGTITGNLITKCGVPVIAVPKNYRKKSVTRLLYTTDFYNYKEELKKVVAFARPLNAKIDMLHLTWPNEILPDRKTMERDIKKSYHFDIGLEIQKTNLLGSLYHDLKKQIERVKPSMIAIFTDQHRSLFQKIFFPSKAEQLSYSSTIPLLVFPKKIE